MTDLATKVPEETVVKAYAGVMAISPALNARLLESLAKRHGVPCDAAFKQYVADVLAKQPHDDFD